MDELTRGYGLIEGPVWDSDRGLLFSDVLGGGIYCVDAAGAVSTVFEHRKGIGGMALHEAGGMVVSGRNISYKPFAGGPTQMLLDRDESEGIVGYNDITADSEGRVYAGSLGNSPVFDDGLEPTPGSLYLIDIDGSVSRVAEDVRLTNGLGFSPDGRTLYHSDTGQQTVFRYAVADDGSLGGKTPFITTDSSPDGLVVSEDGAVWVALASGHGVGVFEPDGSQRQHIRIPDPMCTSVCFGGEDLRDLYIVSGSRGAASDSAGAVYRYRSDVAGLPVGVAKVSLSSN